MVAWVVTCVARVSVWVLGCGLPDPVDGPLTSANAPRVGATVRWFLFLSKRGSAQGGRRCSVRSFPPRMMWRVGALCKGLDRLEDPGGTG